MQSDSVVVDIRSQAGAAPTARTVDHLTSTLRSVSAKTVDRTSGTLGGSGRDWSPDDIRALADATGTTQTRSAAVLHVFYLLGGYAGDDTVLGVAVRSDVVAVFADRVDEAAGLVGDRARVEDAVTMHEAGHVLGLVDLFLATGRQDPEHPGHSPNRASVMYYAVESTLVGSLLDGGPPVDFDAADLRDLAVIRNG